MSDFNGNNVYKTIIVGSGPAGLTAAIYTARGNLDPLVIEGYQSGGQLMLTSEVENYPGFQNGIMGPELMMEFRAQAERFGAEFITKDVTKVELDGAIKKVWVGDELYQAESVIVSTGASANLLGLENESRLMGRGVSTCATCDGFFFKDRTICVIGGGDSAMEEATFLTRFAAKVYIIHRRQGFRANVNSGEETDLDVDGVFVAIGHTPNTKLFEDQLDMDGHGYILTSTSKSQLSATNISGVFACGDVQDSHYRQAITAAGSGCAAALDAEHYLESRNGS
jgi:thioredoxin reductase (NADPH)